MRRQKNKMPRVGYRRRINPYYEGMNRRQIAQDVAKTTAKWLIGTVLAYAYWFFLLLIISVFTLRVWHVTFVQILIYSGVLCAVSSLVYACVLIHRKLYY